MAFDGTKIARTARFVAVLFLLMCAFAAKTAMAQGSGNAEIVVSSIGIDAINTATGQDIQSTNQGFIAAGGYAFNVGLGISGGAIITDATVTTAGFTLVQTTGLGTASITMHLTAPTYSYTGSVHILVHYYTQAAQAGTPQVAFITPSLCGIIGAIRGVASLIALTLLLLAGLVFALSTLARGDLQEKTRTWAKAMAAGGVVGVLIVVLAPVIIGIIETPFAPLALPC